MTILPLPLRLAPSLGGLLILAALAAPGCASSRTSQERKSELCARLEKEGRVPRAASPTAVLAEPDAILAALAAANAEQLRGLAGGVDDLVARAKGTAARIEKQKRAEPYLTPAEAEEMRLLAFDYVKLTGLLSQIVEDHADFAALDDLPPRARTLGVTSRLAAGLLQQDLSLAFVKDFGPLPLAREQLDRGLERDKLPPRLYRKILEASRSLDARVALRRAIERFQAGEAQRMVLADREGGTLRALAARIYESPSYDELRHDEEVSRVLARAPESVQVSAEETGDAIVAALYPAQVFVATLIGDAVTEAREPRIDHAQVERVRALVKPGDIVLERCDYYVSNAFLPGWWGHAALYTGDGAALQGLGLGDDAAVKPHMAEMLQGHDLVESVSEGVVVSSLEHIMKADHIAILRPRFKAPDVLKRALHACFSHVGKAYDFNFDFSTDDTLVCSELCWRSLDGVITVPLTKRFGRFTLTPDELAALAVGKNAQLELVAFVKDGKAAGREEFEAVLK